MLLSLTTPPDAQLVTARYGTRSAMGLSLSLQTMPKAALAQKKGRFDCTGKLGWSCFSQLMK